MGVVELFVISLPSALKSQKPWPDNKTAVALVAPSHISSTADLLSEVLIDQYNFDIFLLPSSVIKVNSEASTFLTNVSPVQSEKIVNLVRAVSPPYPSAFTFLGKKKIFIYEAQLFIDNDFYNDKPGVIVDIFPDFNHFVVKTKDSNILVTNSSISSQYLKVGFRFLEKSGVQIPYPKF